MLDRSRHSLSSYIEDHARNGRYHFSLDEVAAALGQSRAAVRAGLRRRLSKGEISNPAKGFYFIVPYEYRNLESLPPEQVLPALMEYWKRPYYVGLLSAAQLYGAAHQRPQAFQVVTTMQRRSIETGRSAIWFVVRKNCVKIPCVDRPTPRGYVRVSTPEATLLDLVGYAEICGGLDNVATIFSELAEQVEGVRLAEAAKFSPIAWAQRAGYLMELVGAGRKGRALWEYVKLAHPPTGALASWRPIRGAPRAARWNLAVNVKVEPDL